MTRGYFENLGLHASLGRLLTEADHEPGAAPVLVLGRSTWLKYFGGDSGVLGTTVRTERATYTIVGIAPAGFEGTVEDDRVEFWIPVEQYEPGSLIRDRAQRPPGPSPGCATA